jgi:hypothetical protein
MAMTLQRQGYGGDDVFVIIDKGDLSHGLDVVSYQRWRKDWGKLGGFKPS